MRSTVARSLLGWVALAWPLVAPALEISNVYHEPAAIEPTRGLRATVHFRLSELARVQAQIFDGRDLRVRVIESKGELRAGDHTLVWDGRDARGRPVPPEAYVYTLHADGRGEQARWDVTDSTVGENFAPATTQGDAAAGTVAYTLERPARVRIRIGLQNDGPLLRTLIDWVPRSAGAKTERWDGRDTSGVMELATHPRLAIQVEAFALSQNTILVGPEASQVELISDLPEPLVRRAAQSSRPRMLDYARQAIEARRDFPIELALPKELKRDAAGLPIVAGPVPVTLRVGELDLSRVLNERAEAVFYVDGQLVFENQVSFLPMTWTWDPSGAAEGVHYVTANLRGYEGHFGIRTLKVVVSRSVHGNAAARAAVTSPGAKENR